MKQSIVLIGLIVLLIGCSSPVEPVVKNQKFSNETNSNVQTALWGYFDVYIDTDDWEVESVLNRQVMFTANVVNFINVPPPKLGFKINEIPVGADYVDVDIDVSITHPFTGLTQYNGYDVRGIFMGNGSAELEYGNNLRYPRSATDQSMLPDPDDGFGGPDGYTRWFNKSEFSMGGMPLFSYTQGAFATKEFNGNATLCPYKYFADALGKVDDVWNFLTGSPNDSVFSAGVTNTRNYYLRFPNSYGVKYGYAITANWEGVGSEFHPSHAHEAVGVKADITNSIYFTDSDSKGGNLILDISVFDWDSVIQNGVMEDYQIIIESSVLSSPFAVDMTPTDGGVNYSVFHVDIPADNIQSTTGNFFWVIVEDQNFNYSNQFGSPNLAENEPLAAFFRFDLPVSDSPVNNAPVCDLEVVTPMPASDFVSVDVEFDASGSYDLDSGDSLTFLWDFDGDNIFSDTDPDDTFTGTDSNPIHTYNADYTGVVRVKVIDDHGAYNICVSDPLDVTIIPGCGNMEVPSGVCNPVPSAPFSAYLAVDRTRGSGPIRAICNPLNIWQLCTVSLPPDNSIIHTSAASTSYINNIGVTSNNRIFYANYNATVLNYVDYNDTTGFGPIDQKWPSGSGLAIPGSGRQIFGIAVDANDRPIVLAINNSSNPSYPPMIYHWNGTNWGTGIPVDTDIATYTNNTYLPQGNWRNISDFEYDPSTGYYLLTVGNNPIFDVWISGNPSVFALDSTGNIVWQLIDLWGGTATGYVPGVDVLYDDPECHIVLCASQQTYNPATRWARVNNEGGEKVLGTTTSPSGSLVRGIGPGNWGSVIPKQSGGYIWWGYAYHSGNNPGFAWIDMPSSF